MTAPAIELSAQQAEAGEKIGDWYADDDSDQVFRLFGYAGTGKTSTARFLIDQLGVRNVAYAAYTGKAAYVLRTKGCDNASTIHSLIYLPAEKARQRLRELQEKFDTFPDPDARAVIGRQIEVERKNLESPNWILRQPEESNLSGVDLLVIDEVSMVSERVGLDLLSYDIKTLVLGDPAQLPPVDGGGYFIEAEPDHLLTEIHRSALDSPVTRIATAVRQSITGDLTYGVTGLDGDSGRVSLVSRDDLLAFDQVLCGTNKTRWAAIHLIRALRGLTTVLPTGGDRIMILANSGSAEVFNGQQFTVREGWTKVGQEDRVRLVVTDDEGTTRDLTCWTSGFTGLEGEDPAKRDGRGTIAAATFGQAITVHKSQGSQWDRVLVIDESSVFAGIEAREYAKKLKNLGLPDTGGSRGAGHQAGRRWLYTAATRAAHRVSIIPGLYGAVGL